MKFLVYETTNQINGKKYRGAHCCLHEVCCYLGSGTLFKRALVKYGTENFNRQILRECSSLDEMYATEAELVTADWVANPSTYNLKVGGEGGWDYINKTGSRWNEEKKKAHSAEMKKRRAVGEWGPKSLPMLGKTFSQTPEARRKISENHASRLNPEVIEQRKHDMLQCSYPQRGSVKKLAELWEVSHTQVRRFCNEHCSRGTD